LIAVSKDSICFGSIGSGNYEMSVMEDKLPAGIVTFFLFDKNGKLLSERAIYLKQRSVLTAQMNKPVYNKREKVVLDIKVKDAGGLPLLTTLSLSVANNQFIELPDRNNAEPRDLILPEDTAFSDEETDLLMLSRKSIYKNLLGNPAHTTALISNDSLLYIFGTVKNTKNNPLAGKPIVLFRKESSFWDIDTTDAHGRFCFRLTDYSDSSLFTLQSTIAENWVIELDTFRVPRFNNAYVHSRKFGREDHVIPASYNASQFETNSKEVLAPVTVFGKRETDSMFIDKRQSKFSYIIPSSKIGESGSYNVSTAVLMAPGAQLLNGYLVIKGPSTMAGSVVNESSEPMVLVNGAPVSVGSVGRSDMTSSPVLNFLNTFDRHSIEFIEILSGPEAAIYGMRGGQGVILINTRTTPEERAGIHKNIINKPFYAKGYSRPTLFPSVVYDKKKQTIPDNTDQRSTIYWNPDILTDKEGKASVSFYTNDVPGKYSIIIRGVTAHGDIINKLVTYILQ
jgi:TonB-dependent SusC/RagA subfamily outer membrane receptor